jgi:hypothetical protein
MRSRECEGHPKMGSQTSYVSDIMDVTALAPRRQHRQRYDV